VQPEPRRRSRPRLDPKTIIIQQQRNPYDPVRPVPTPEPRDELRWPYGKGPYYADLGTYGHGLYGSGNASYDPGMMADRILSPGNWSGLPSPEERILRRPQYPVGPWVRVGHLLGESTQSSEVLPLFMRNVTHRSGYYDYRVTAGRESTVPVDVRTNTERINDGTVIQVPGLGNRPYELHYNQYVF